MEALLARSIARSGLGHSLLGHGKVVRGGLSLDSRFNAPTGDWHGWEI
jgi:hypothetical protein